MAFTMAAITPIIHLNGTSREALVEQRCEAYSAIGSAIDAINRMAPNGRDYYLESGRLEKAEVRHRERLQLLADLQDELVEEIDIIS